MVVRFYSVPFFLRYTVFRVRPVYEEPPEEGGAPDQLLVGWCRSLRTPITGSDALNKLILSCVELSMSGRIRSDSSRLQVITIRPSHGTSPPVLAYFCSYMISGLAVYRLILFVNSRRDLRSVSAELSSIVMTGFSNSRSVQRSFSTKCEEASDRPPSNSLITFQLGRKVLPLPGGPAITMACPIRGVRANAWT